MKATRKLITVNEDLCNGCGNCVTGCAEGALAIIDGKAKLVNEVFCDGLGACLGECPTGALKVVEVEVEDFDPEAVAKHLKAQGREVPDHMPDPASLRLDQKGSCATKPGGCPGSRAMTLNRPAPQASASPCQQANVPRQQAASISNLTHWPIQLRLVPPTAPFLQNARLLLTADCVPPSFPDFNERFLAGRIMLLGCPKFDDAQSYIDKVADILRNNRIKDITVVQMEVPCCAGMTAIAQRGAHAAGVDVPITTTVITRDGQIQDPASGGFRPFA
ncbi:MAG TPA: 4Fe-4S dicluster domain-containing protein [Humidesulfovibrio sp.]|uniref:ATP-binding protein n=1 Tax=Humidesulfovibrio sp. TaxID=2910988 RepID=UPI002C3104BE|nr:4Fe-4S dicluster domain-containing protein [Humidesulfovibrio sp.]HWR03263.1 4Fe-4S dicluster domain-containing protein [Humidesulfovibrio sp.]